MAGIQVNGAREDDTGDLVISGSGYALLVALVLTFLILPHHRQGYTT